MRVTYLEPGEVLAALDEVVSQPAGYGQIDDGLGLEPGLLHQQVNVLNDEVVAFLKQVKLITCAYKIIQSKFYIKDA